MTTKSEARSDNLKKIVLSKEIAAYESMQSMLETDHFGKWVIIRDQKLEGFYDSSEAAAENAVEKFGAGPYLIRKVGAAPVTLPASVIFRPVPQHA